MLGQALKSAELSTGKRAELAAKASGAFACHSGKLAQKHRVLQRYSSKFFAMQEQDEYMYALLLRTASIRYRPFPERGMRTRRGLAAIAAKYHLHYSGRRVLAAGYQSGGEKRMAARVRHAGTR